jgi:hypothetical protein
MNAIANWPKLHDSHPRKKPDSRKEQVIKMSRIPVSKTDKIYICRRIVSWWCALRKKQKIGPVELAHPMFQRKSSRSGQVVFLEGQKKDSSGREEALVDKAGASPKPRDILIAE